MILCYAFVWSHFCIFVYYTCLFVCVSIRKHNVCMRAFDCTIHDRMWVATTEQHSHLNSRDISILSRFWLSIASQVWWGTLFHVPLHYKGEKGQLNRRGSQHTMWQTVCRWQLCQPSDVTFLDIGPRSYKAGLFGILWWVGFPSGAPVGHRWPPMPKFAWDRGSSDCWTCTGSSGFSIPASDHPWGHCLARSCRDRSPWNQCWKALRCLEA